MRINFLLFVIILFTFTNIKAQDKQTLYQITGQVIESSSAKGIPYVTITVKNDSTQFIKKLCTDVSGNFSVTVKDKGTYMLIFSAVGFANEKITKFLNELKTDVGKIMMKEGLLLKEVLVTAQKPLIKVDIDKISYSMESDPEAQTSNGLEMLRKVPLLSVDGDENVTLNGQSNYKVLVNGKSSAMMSKNFKEVMKSLPANTIKDIEVITNPPSKYDAEGIGGIINIITVKKTLNGYNGSVSAGFNNFGSVNGSILLTTKVNKLGFSGRYGFNQLKRPTSTNFSNRENYLSTESYYTNQTGSRSNDGLSHQFNGEASYDIDSLNLISMSFWGYIGEYQSNGNSTTAILNTQKQPTSSFGTENNGKFNYGSLSGNIDYQKTYKKPDKSFTISYKLDNNPYGYDFETQIKESFNYIAYNQQTKSNEFTQEQTIQIDYYDPLSKMHQIECGVKGIYRENNSNSDVFLFNNTTIFGIKSAKYIQSSCLKMNF